MNCFSSPRSCRLRGNLAALALLAMAAACGAPASESSETSGTLTYRMTYRVDIDADAATATVRVDLAQSTALLREVRWRPDSRRMSGFEGDGDLRREAGIITWRPPEDGGSLEWRVNVPSERVRGSFDAWLSPNWGLFRAEDIIPRAATRVRKGARSETRLRFRLPAGWSVVTQYAESGGHFHIANPERRFDLPTGWIVMGDLGVRRETIAGIRVIIAGPVGASVRRMDMLALLNWTLPELARIVPTLPSRLTVVSANDPMWRGGLSAPQSLYIHAERPLLSENGTSTLLHEVLHTTLGIRGQPGADWIDEGLAEFYTLQLLRRSGTITKQRYETALQDLRDWGDDSDTLCGGASTGATTARAVGLFTRLDTEIRSRSAGSASLDDVVRTLGSLDRAVNLADLGAAAAHAAGEKTDTLHGSRLPGCRSISPGSSVELDRRDGPTPRS